MTKNRGFELISKYEGHSYLLPERATAHSAGYDLKSAETIEILPNEIKLVPTGIKSYMRDNEVLFLMDRSSNPRKKGIVLINSVGVIDTSYCGDGDEWLFPCLATEPTTVRKGDRICQFRLLERMPPLNMEFCSTLGNKDRGGHGSTGKQ